MKRELVQAIAVSVLALPMLAGLSGSAQAETNPRCSSVTQIGTTAHVTSGGRTFASVKQFKGCNKNWAYVYVWTDWRNSHSSWDACAAVTTRSSSGGTTVEDPSCNSGRFTELWSHGASTLSQCTRALGWKGYGPFPDSNDPKASTSERC
ncbi:hypothetical protein ACSDR0_00010 [Streptosporangium sp. G11]|uniref:hypothetical protein n=1 Tax=Streptosporangium sp. G11 TaxID=3436926 RepID=UPI003EBF990F